MPVYLAGPSLVFFHARAVHGTARGGV